MLSQLQALQALQGQQGNLISTLSPLLPLLQAVPLHIETARNVITEAFLKVVPKPSPVKTPVPMLFSSDLRTEDRSSSTLPSGGPPLFTTILSPRKRPRLESELGEIQQHRQHSTPRNRDGSPIVRSQTRRRTESHALFNRRLTVQNTALPSRAFRTSLSTVSSSFTHRDLGPLKKPARHASTTPHCPLTDIRLSSHDSISSFNGKDIPQHPTASSENRDELIRQSTPVSLSGARDRPQDSTSFSGTRRDLTSLSREPTPVSLSGATSTRPGPKCTPRLVHQRSSVSFATPSNPRPAEGHPASGSRGREMYPGQQPQNPLAYGPSINFRPISSTTEVAPVDTGGVSLSDLKTPTLAGIQMLSSSSGSVSRPARGPQRQSTMLGIPSGGCSNQGEVSDQTMSAAVRKPMSIKDRKAHGLLAQFTLVSVRILWLRCRESDGFACSWYCFRQRNEGKRFIPLDDDDDDEDEE